MEVIPAIDIKGGKCVRLFRGRPETQVIYGDDPVATARMWVRKGATRLHVIDLDGAFQGKPIHLAVVDEIVKGAGVPVQLGGGIRTDEDVERALAVGVDRVILSTRALEDQAWLSGLLERFPGRIIVSVDAEAGKVALKGWKEPSSIDAIDAIRRLEKMGVDSIIFTDISRDGTLEGLDVTAIERVIASVSVPIVVAGGITSKDDLLALKSLGVSGAIIGRGLYACTISLEEAIEVAK